MSRTDEKATADVWLSASRKGFRELSLGHVGLALNNWREAAQVLTSDGIDPRFAAAKNNEGVACLLLSRVAEAEASLAEASDSWRQVRDRVGVMDVPVAGRSSSFHLRLAIHHSETFREAARRRYEQQCDAALAITRFNAWLADQRRIEQVEYGAISETLARGFGHGSPEVGVLTSLSQDFCDTLPKDDDDRTKARLFAMYGEKLSRGAVNEGAWRQAPPTEAQKLDVAAHMTALCDPRLYVAPRSLKKRFER